MILKEIETGVKEKLRMRLESQGINVDVISMEDIDKLNITITEEKDSSDEYGSDSSADDGLPLHLERIANV
jgi:hypothetical protein